MIHIYPLNDLREHEMNSTCFCNPEVKEAGDGELMCVHNSLDGREGLELANELLNGIDRESSLFKENDVIQFDNDGCLTKATIISIQYNPNKYFIEDENGRFYQIDESDIV